MAASLNQAFCWTAAVVLMAVSAQQLQAEISDEQQVLEFIDEMVQEYGFQRKSLVALFDDATVQESVIERISRPAEHMSWKNYRAIFITDERIAAGVGFMREYQEQLAKAESLYRVAPQVVSAIIGVETYYGQIQGSDRVLDSLSTLAFRYPPRASFFRSELKHFLLLACEERVRPFDAPDSCTLAPGAGSSIASGLSVTDLMGSYAGAMGYGQFISSSFRNFAIDFDGDQSRDIWNNPADAIGSVANYFAQHGWKGGGEVVERVSLSGEDAPADEFANTGLELERTVMEWKQFGVRTKGGDQDLAALFRMEGKDGNEYWLGYHDFYVITRYNRSSLYALAVWQLAEMIDERSQQ